MVPSAVLAAAATLAATAAQPAREDYPPPPQPNPYFTYDDVKPWIVRGRFFIYPDGRRVNSNFLFQGGAFEQFQFVAPIVRSTGHAWTDPDSKEFPFWEVGLSAGNTAEYAARVATVPGSEAPYLILSADRPIATSVIQVAVETLIYTSETEFDEKKAWNLPWPDEWPAEAAAWLTPDPVLDVYEVGGADPVLALLQKWTGGRDPREVPPVQLAKYLTGHVTEHVRTAGMNAERPQERPPVVLRTSEGEKAFKILGRAPNFAGFIAGFRIQNAADIAVRGIGSEHDLSILLTAVLRRAGIPTRTVIGVDKRESGFQDRLKSYVEFAMVAPEVDGVIWVPVDIWDLEGSGRTTQNWQQPWDGFGTSDLLRWVAPVAFHFHPPANYQSWYYPALFGIRFDEGLGNFGLQGVYYEINSLPSSGPQR